MAWTSETIERLTAMWEKGQTASQIAAELGEGFTRNAVIGKAHRLGLKARPSPVKADAKTDDVPEREAAGSPAPAAAAPQKAAPRPAPRKAAEEKKNDIVTLLDLTDRMCKWPIGHPGDADFRFCGKPNVTGTPYCAEHCGQAYQSHQPRRDRPRPLPGLGRE